ncbi:MAG: CBS domain-containing protein [Myxococcales bacterium]|nr:CBS domain-containing protein [Myxococcales bacterium]
MPVATTPSVPTARHMMTTRLHTVRSDQPVLDVVKLLLKQRVSGAPVVDDRYHLVGMLSEKDCIQALLRAVSERLPSSQVRDVMSPEPVTVSPDADLLTVSHLFVTRPMRRLPVVSEEGLLLGQISRRDLLQAAVEVWDRAPSREAAVLYLSATGQRAPV